MHPLFKFALVIGLAGFGLPGAAPAALQIETAEPNKPHASSATVKKELTAVIQAQLAAFRAGDFAKAYTFAADEIREQFPLEAFEKMVQAGYPLIAQSTRAEFGLAFDTGEEAVVVVKVEDAQKRSGEFQYLLKKQAGQWKITGVSAAEPKRGGSSA